MDEHRATQKSAILAHLMRFGSIEPMTALSEYGSYRLADVIFRLRADGYKIVTETIIRISRITGKPVHFANYILK